ncbi:MAG: tail fiber domain-containing protein [Bacteroidetes bacterium]|nr:tail fiber domain-containing protein [Bacteroidota bacterium]
MSTGSTLAVDNLAFFSGGVDLVRATATADTWTLTSNGASGVLVTGVADPTADSDAANKKYVDSLNNGLSWLAPVRVVSTVNGNFATAFQAGETLDGIVLVAGDRVLLNGQTNAVENGIQVVNATGAPSRPADFASGSVVNASAVFVIEGTQGDAGYVLSSENVIVDTTPQTWVQFSGAGQITAGAGLTKTADTLSVNTDGVTIQVNGSDNLEVIDGGISTAKLADEAVTTIKILDANVTTAKLADSAVTTVKIADSNVTTAKIADANVTNAKLAVDSVATANIIDANVTNAKLANDSVTVTAGTGLSDGGAVSLGSSVTLNVDPAQVVLTTTDQSIAGVKTFTDATASTTPATGAVVLSAGGLGVNGDVRSAGSMFATSFTTSSDMNLKTKIKDVPSTESSKIYDVEVKTYKWKEEFNSNDKATKCGVIAQQLKEVYPEFVYQNGQHLAVDYNSLFGMMLAEMQALSSRVKELEASIESK